MPSFNVNPNSPANVRKNLYRHNHIGVCPRCQCQQPRLLIQSCSRGHELCLRCTERITSNHNQWQCFSCDEIQTAVNRTVKFTTKTCKKQTNIIKFSIQEPNQARKKHFQFVLANQDTLSLQDRAIQQKILAILEKKIQDGLHGIIYNASIATTSKALSYLIPAILKFDTFSVIYGKNDNDLNDYHIDLSVGQNQAIAIMKCLNIFPAIPDDMLEEDEEEEEIFDEEEEIFDEDAQENLDDLNESQIMSRQETEKETLKQCNLEYSYISSSEYDSSNCPEDDENILNISVNSDYPMVRPKMAAIEIKQLRDFERQRQHPVVDGIDINLLDSSDENISLDDNMQDNFDTFSINYLEVYAELDGRLEISVDEQEKNDLDDSIITHIDIQEEIKEPVENLSEELNQSIPMMTDSTNTNTNSSTEQINTMPLETQENNKNFVQKERKFMSIADFDRFIKEHDAFERARDEKIRKQNELKEKLNDIQDQLRKLIQNAAQLNDHNGQVVSLKETVFDVKDNTIQIRLVFDQPMTAQHFE